MSERLEGEPTYTCPLCKDKAYTGEKRCLECNPVGLPVEKVHPKIEAVGRVVEVKEEEERIDVVVELTHEGQDKLKEIGVIPEEVADDSDSGTGQTDSDTGKLYTSKPKRTKKHQAKK